MGEHRSTTELREYLKTVAKENDTMTRSNRDRRGARKVRTQSAEPAYTGIINVYKLVNRDETVEREREQTRVFIPTHITPEQDKIIKNDQKLLGIYQQLIFHGRSIPTSDIRISESEAECQQIIHEYITDSTNPKNVLFKFRNKSSKGWYEHKLSAYQMLQLVKLFPGIAHGSYDVKNIRASYSRSQKGVYAFYIKKEVVDLLKKIGMKIPEDKGQHGDATPARNRSKNKNKDKTVPPVEKPVEQPQAPVDDASDVITLPNLEGGEVESGREIERRGKRAKAVMNRAGPKKQGNPVFGKMASVIGVPSFTMLQPTAKKPAPTANIGAGTVASARKMVTRAQTGPMFGTSIFPAIGQGQIGGPAPKKKTPKTSVNIDIAVPAIMRKRRR
ncbi:MAG: hypothetical protein WC922_08160 [Synergistaceae bacterium]|jgi:hypothetical protein